ncbi:uncharacterized protein LOC144612765 [Panthera onca]
MSSHPGGLTLTWVHRLPAGMREGLRHAFVICGFVSSGKIPTSEIPTLKGTSITDLFVKWVFCNHRMSATVKCYHPRSRVSVLKSKTASALPWLCLQKVTVSLWPR